MIYRVSIDAFTLTPEVAAALQAVRDDRLFAKSKVNVLAGGLAAAAVHYADTPTPQLVIVEEDADDAAMMTRLEQLAEVCEPGTRVVVIGNLNDITLYRTLLSQGVSEYLLRPVTAGQITAAIAAIFEDPNAAARGKLVAVWGARGGVGASTLAQNLAWCIGHALDEEVIYVDLDVCFGTSSMAFNVDGKQTVTDCLADPERLDQTLMERFLVNYDDCLSVLASNGDPRTAIPVDVEALDKLLDLVGRMAPVVVADLPHMWVPWTEHLLSIADELIVVSTADLVCLRDTNTLLEALAGKRREGTEIRLVLNRFEAARRTQLAPKDFEETLNMVPALLMPYEPQLFGQAGNNGRMLGDENKAHKAVELLKGFALQVAGKTPTAKKGAKAKPSLLASLLGKRGK